MIITERANAVTIGGGSPDSVFKIMTTVGAKGGRERVALMASVKGKINP